MCGVEGADENWFVWREIFLFFKKNSEETRKWRLTASANKMMRQVGMLSVVLFKWPGNER